MSVFGVILFIIGVVGLLLTFFVKDEEEDAYAYRKYSVIAIAVVVVGILLTCLATVPRGHVGVALQFSAVTGDYRTQGLQVKSPVVKLLNMSVQTQKYEVPASAVSSDLQVVNTVVTVNYHLDPSKAPEVYRDIGEEYIETIAAPAVQETLKQITALFKAEDLIQRRPEVKVQVTDTLTARLGERGVIVETVSLTDFQFSDVFDAAIEAKVAAEQAVLEAQNKLERIKVEAQQREAQALGEANAAIKEAEGKAKAITIVTEAQVRANEAIAESLSPEVLQYIFYDRLGKEIKVIVIPQGQNFVIPEMAVSE